MTNSKNKRSQARLDVFFNIRYQDAHDFAADYVSNLSGKGIFIATNRHFETGEDIEFTISFPGLMEPIRCKSIVQWRRPPEKASESTPAGIGVAFVMDNAEEAHRIQRLLEMLQQTSPKEEQDNPFRVLLVESNPNYTEELLCVFRAFYNMGQSGKRPFEVICVNSDKKAWKSIDRTLRENRAYDLIIVGMDSESIDGQQLIEKIFNTDPIVSLPVVAISKEIEQRQSIYLAGADLFISRPIQIGQLFEFLQKLIFLNPSV
jgi:uncharacterized protein (TIGR02266 family)